MTMELELIVELVSMASTFPIILADGATGDAYRTALDDSTGERVGGAPILGSV